jgi:hypothetical protein
MFSVRINRTIQIFLMCLGLIQIQLFATTSILIQAFNDHGDLIASTDTGFQLPACFNTAVRFVATTSSGSVTLKVLGGTNSIPANGMSTGNANGNGIASTTVTTTGSTQGEDTLIALATNANGVSAELRVTVVLVTMLPSPIVMCHEESGIVTATIDPNTTVARRIEFYVGNPALVSLTGYTPSSSPHTITLQAQPNQLGDTELNVKVQFTSAVCQFIKVYVVKVIAVAPRKPIVCAGESTLFDAFSSSLGQFPANEPFWELVEGDASLAPDRGETINITPASDFTGPITVSAACGGQTDKPTGSVSVIGVADITYHHPICPDELIHFEAIPLGGGSFPPNQPVWTGGGGVDGQTGPFATAKFNVGEITTVTATCGTSSKTVNIVVLGANLSSRTGNVPVSPDNAARNTWMQFRFDRADSLSGPTEFGFNSVASIGNPIEIVGALNSMPDAGTQVRLNRLATQVTVWVLRVEGNKLLILPELAVGNVPDLSDDGLRDDNPDPNNTIYDLDAPGPQVGSPNFNKYNFPNSAPGPKVGDYILYRANVVEWAEMNCNGKWVKISSDFAWTASVGIKYVREITQNGQPKRTWVPRPPPAAFHISHCPEVGPGSVLMTIDGQ